MQRVRNLSFSSILPLLTILFFVLITPSSLVNSLRRGMMRAVIPIEKGAAKALRLPSIISQELNYEQIVEGFSKTEEQGITSKVIYREMRSYNNAIWIDMGTWDNDKQGYPAIGVNSPVVSKGCLVGVVDEVFERYSRVRLITDKKFTPSVRAVRGGEQKKGLLQRAKSALEPLQSIYSQDSSEATQVASLLAQVEHTLSLDPDKSYHLAKGELRGSLSRALGTQALLVEGVGFNYDPEKMVQVKGSLLQKGDLLVTTGLDGVFPAKIPVAVVTKVGSLELDEPFYSIEAKLLADHLFHLQSVQVLPSQGFKLAQ